MSTEDIIAKSNEYLMNTYARLPVAFVRGEGMKLWDADGAEYLDFAAGIAVNALGYAHPAVTAAIHDQAGQLMHTSNLYHIGLQADLAEKLINLTFPGKVFFSNSGAEANECAIKLARKYAKLKRPGDPHAPYEIITAGASFHGRTLATLAATGQAFKQAPFTPLPAGFKHVAFNDIGAMEAAVNDMTCAVMLELVQGEGGVVIAHPDYITDIRKLCDEHDLIFIIDEVQTGIGRTGTMFAYEQYEVEPDVMTLAKALGNGMPIGATIARGPFGDVFEQGDHGSTFGGNFMACRAASAVLDAIHDQSLVGHAAAMGVYLLERLYELWTKHDGVVEVRGLGLMAGIQLAGPFADWVGRTCMEAGVIVTKAGANVVRVLPPLIVEKADIDVLANVLGVALAGLPTKEES